MESYTTRSLSGLGTFVLLLFCVEVLSAPTVRSVIDVIKGDSKICKTYPFLYNNSITEECTMVPYPVDKDLKLNEQYIDTFLCLGVYDTAYKLCHYSEQWQNPFNDTAAFNTQIKKFFPKETEEVQFCKNVQNITPMYNKTKPFVSKLTDYLNTSLTCHSVCFTYKQEFRPICALLAWINFVDEDVKKRLQNQHITDGITISNKDYEPTEDVGPIKPVHEELPEGAKKDVAVKNNYQENIAQDQKGNGNSNLPDANALNAKDSQKAVGETQPLDNGKMQDSSIPQPDPVLSKSPVNADVVGTPAKEKVDDSIKDKSMETPLKNISNNLDGGDVDTGIPAEKFDAKLDENDDIKTSTISDNTQNDKIPQDYEKLPYDPDDGIDSMDGSDQNQNMPEPSEQRDNPPRYHSIRAEDESHFFTYFTLASLVCIVGYIGYHNKQKILAIVLEGRRSRKNRGRRRPSTASYRKLHCTLEEAVNSQCNANVTHVIY